MCCHEWKRCTGGSHYFGGRPVHGSFNYLNCGDNDLARRFENSPLVIAEAQAAGIPVLVADRGEPAERVKDGVDGRHYIHRDAASLAQMLQEIVDDPSRIEAMSAAIEPPPPVSSNFEEMESFYHLAMDQAGG